MPRKAPKEVIEHRITLGDFERKQLEQSVNAFQTDKYLENIPHILQASGVILVGGSLGAGAYVLHKWLFGGSLFDDFFKATNSTLDAIVGTSLQGLMGYDPIEHIRDRQALDEEFKKVSADIDAYCVIGAKTFDEQKCDFAHTRKDELFERKKVLEAQQEAEKQAVNPYEPLGVRLAKMFLLDD